jgi:hypothetical protein
MSQSLRRHELKNPIVTSLKTLATSITLLFFSAIAFGQEVSTSASNVTRNTAGLSNTTSGSATSTPPGKWQPRHSALTKQTKNVVSAGSATSPIATEGWQLEIRPYVWLAGIHGQLRVRNTTADTSKSSSNVLGMLDFAAAAQVEAIKGPWRLMFDENYVNLGTTGTGPFGNVSVKVEPTMNIFEFGGSYTAVAVPNKKASATNPLPPIFTAEILGGGRFFHLSVGLEPSNAAAVEGSRNLVGPFIGNRFKVSPNKALTLIGKYTVGGSGAGSNFAWSAEGLVDLRLKKGFSIGGGYRVLGINADQPSNTVGFDGQLRGLILTMTLYR